MTIPGLALYMPARFAAKTYHRTMLTTVFAAKQYGAVGLADSVTIGQ